jgi:hypothetical protein
MARQSPVPSSHWSNALEGIRNIIIKSVLTFKGVVFFFYSRHDSNQRNAVPSRVSFGHHGNAFDGRCLIP